MFVSLGRRALYGLATSSRVESVVHAVQPVERLAHRAASRYVAGWDLAGALVTVRRLVDAGFAVSLDLFGEGAVDQAALARVIDGYREAAVALDAIDGDVYLEVVPSHLGLDFGLDVCRRHIEQIVEVLPAGSRLEISAEEGHRTPRIMELISSLAAAGAPVLATVQANLRRSPQDVDYLAAAGVPIRLVKGAYLESPDIAHPWGEPTDLAYVDLAQRVHAAGVGLALATHDPVIREALVGFLPGASIEMLLGVREEDAADQLARGRKVRIYAPYGQSWFRYWMRRVAEARGA